MSPEDHASPGARRRFVLEHTAPGRPVLVPEIPLRMGTEVTPLWSATEEWLRARDVPVPFWAFAWPGGQALAAFVLDHPALVRGRRVLDFATGSGLVALAAIRAGAARVTAVDLDPFAVAAAKVNADAAGLDLDVVAVDLLGDSPPDVDLILAGDVFYDAAMARRVDAWFLACARAGRQVVVADPGRRYMPTAHYRALAAYRVPTTLELESTRERITTIHEVALES
ncbi:MAG: 50S ribosomal protein L11 methyltransferase [Polyangiaceae bacterium]